MKPHYTATRKKGKPTAAATAAQTRYFSSPAADTLHGKHTVSCSGFLPKIKPMQHSCSYSNAIMQPEIQEPHRSTHTGTTTRCKTNRRNNSRMKRPQPHPPHRRGTFLRWLQPFYTEKNKVSCSGFLPNMTHTTFMLCNRSFKNRIELRTQEQPLVAKQIGGTIRAWRDPSRIRRTDEVPFFGGCSRFTRKKNKVSCSGFLPKYNPYNIHALQPQLQEPHRTTHTGTTNRCKTHRRKNSCMKRPQPHPPHRRGTFLRHMQRHFTRKNTWFHAPASSPKHNHATFMQPFQCDLQQQLQEPHRTTHTGTTTRWKTHRRNNSRMKRPQPHPPHRQGTFLRHMQTLYTEKHTVSCPGFLPKHYPCNIHVAIPMRSCNQRF